MSRFLRIRCSKCEAEMLAYGSSTTPVACKCGEAIVLPSGGKADIRARILEVL